jgi:hypothetical protein
LGLIAPWQLGGKPAFPTLDGFAVLSIFGAIAGALLGFLTLPLVLLNVRSFPSRRSAELTAGIGDFVLGLLFAWVCVFAFLHIPVELKSF